MGLGKHRLPLRNLPVWKRGHAIRIWYELEHSKLGSRINPRDIAVLGEARCLTDTPRIEANPSPKLILDAVLGRNYDCFPPYPTR
jgi:hypothetical protein